MDGEITPEEVEALLDTGRIGDSIRIVDIRSRVAFEHGHIPGSEHLPFADLPSRVDILTGAERIVTVCPHGEASVQAARLIKSYEGTADARVESMAGGLEAWHGGVERGHGAPSGADTGVSDASDAPDAPF